MFKDTLRDLVEGTDGAIACVLMDASGIAIESFAKPDPAFDINAVGVEYGVLIAQIRHAAEMLEAGTAQEVAVGTDRLMTLLRPIGEHYFIALALLPSGNVGKGRYLLRTTAPRLAKDL